MALMTGVIAVQECWTVTVAIQPTWSGVHIECRAGGRRVRHGHVRGVSPTLAPARTVHAVTEE